MHPFKPYTTRPLPLCWPAVPANTYNGRPDDAAPATDVCAGLPRDPSLPPMHGERRRLRDWPTEALLQELVRRGVAVPLVEDAA